MEHALNNCKQCHADSKHPHCPPCEQKLLRAGLCKWCGLNPRKPKRPGLKQSDYCLECGERMRITQGLPLPEYQARYRDRDARENTWETKNL